MCLLGTRALLASIKSQIVGKYTLTKLFLNVKLEFQFSCGKDGKQIPVHQNMLFPLNLTIESDIQSKFPEEASVKDETDLHKSNNDVNDSDRESFAEQPVYQGPLTRSHVKTLMKANLLMMNHFELNSDDNTLEPVKWGIRNIIPRLITTLHQLFR